MNLTSSIRRTAKHPTTRRTAWIAALAAAAAAAVGATVYFSKTASASTSSSWTMLQPTVGTNGAQVTIPANTPFAFGDVLSDPQLNSIVAQLNSLYTNGQIAQTTVSQGAAPAGFPADNLPKNSYRVLGATTNGNVTFNVTQTSVVWIKRQPAPTPANFLAPITDPATVTQYQTIFAAAIANAGTAGLVTGPGGPTYTTADYSTADVDGNPANPKWVKVLASFQAYANTGAPFSNVPAGYPATLRTDGVLDYATALMIQNA